MRYVRALKAMRAMRDVIVFGAVSAVTAVIVLTAERYNFQECIKCQQLQEGQEYQDVIEFQDCMSSKIARGHEDMVLSRYQECSMRLDSLIYKIVSTNRVNKYMIMRALHVLHFMTRKYLLTIKNL